MKIRINYYLTPISLTSQTCKVLESILRDNIVNHLNTHTLLLKSQHGFTKRKSCLTNLLSFLEDVTKAIDEGKPLDVIYLDFSKAFDKVPHKRLPVKYFTDRSKAVLLLWIFYVFVLSCVCYVVCASVYMCFVVTYWERADLLALVCGVFCEFVTFPMVSWVRCGT